VVAANHHGCCGDPYSDGYLLEFSLDGQLLRTIDVEPSTPKAYDAVTGVTADASSRIYVTGWGGVNPYVMAYTLGGTLLWHAEVGASAGAEAVAGLGVATQAGVLAAVFMMQPTGTRHTIYELIRFSTNGAPLWHRDVRARMRDAYTADVAVGPGGRISLAVEHRGRPLLRTFSPGGSALWGARIGTELTHPPALRGVAVSWRSVFVAGDPVDRYGKPIGGRLWRYRA
jgi:outer membrane protein assembly factor BamB